MSELDLLVEQAVPFLAEFAKTAQSIAVFAIGIALYAFLVWHFYRHLAKRDIVKFNLPPSEKRFTRILFATIKYILTYFVVFPIISFIWFAVLALLLFFLAKSQTVPAILMISMAIVAAARVAAYYREDMAQEITKLLPYVMLAVALTEPRFFSTDLLLARVNSLQDFLPQLPIYILFLIVLEVSLKILLQLKRFVLGENNKLGTSEVVKEQTKDLLFVLQVQQQTLERLNKLEQKQKVPPKEPRID